MSRQRINADDWVDAETKVADQVSQVFKPRAKNMSLVNSRGKAVKLRIPAALMPEVKRAFNGEFWSAETIDDATAPSIYSFFTQIVQGDTSGTRQGDMIRVQKVVIRLWLEPSTSLSYSTVNLAVLLDCEPGIGAPAMNEVFQGGLSTSKGYHAAIPNYDKRSRFLFKQREAVPMVWSAAYWNGTSAVVSARPVTLTLEIPVNRIVKYDGTSARPYSGCELMLFAWSDVTANTPKAYASYEIFYVDV